MSPSASIEFEGSGPFHHDGEPGSILDILLGHGVHLEHACGGKCACTTCHVIVKEGEQNLSPTHREGRGRARHRARPHDALAPRLSGDREGRHHDRDPEVHDQPGVREPLTCESSFRRRGGRRSAGELAAPTTSASSASSSTPPGPRPGLPPGGGRLQRVHVDAARPGEGRVARPGPVPRRRPSPRALLLGAAWHDAAAVARQRLQGARERRAGLRAAGARRTSARGRARASSCSTRYSLCRRTPRTRTRARVGALHRRGDRGREREPARTPCSCSGEMPLARRARSSIAPAIR